jgi:hypothetical protein
MLLSREVLPDFAILSLSMCCISFVGRVFGNIHCVGSVGCYMTGPKTQTNKDKGPKPTDGDCISHLELKEMMCTSTKTFESHTIDADSSPLGSIYLFFSSLDENIANEYNEWEESMDMVFALYRMCDRQKK